MWLVEGDKEKHRVEKSTPFLKEIRHLSITQPRPLKPSECTPYYTPGLLIINSPGIHRLASIRHTRMAKLRHLTSWLPYHRARAFSPLILTLRGVKQTIFGDFTRSSASCMCLWWYTKYQLHTYWCWLSQSFCGKYPHLITLA